MWLVSTQCGHIDVFLSGLCKFNPNSNLELYRTLLNIPLIPNEFLFFLLFFFTLFVGIDLCRQGPVIIRQGHMGMVTQAVEATALSVETLFLHLLGNCCCISLRSLHCGFLRTESRPDAVRIYSMSELNMDIHGVSFHAFLASQVEQSKTIPGRGYFCVDFLRVDISSCLNDPNSAKNGQLTWP